MSQSDLIICKRTRPVLVLHERKSRVTLAARLAGKTAAETISVMLAVFARVNRRCASPSPSTMIPPSPSTPCCEPCRAMMLCDAYASWQKGRGRKPPTADYDAGCLVRPTSTKCPTRKFRTSSSLPISRPENAWASRPLFRQSSKSLAKTCKSGLHSPVALGSRIQAALGATFGTRLDIDVRHFFSAVFRGKKGDDGRWPYRTRSTLSTLNRGSTSWRTKTKPGGKADSERRSATVSALTATPRSTSTLTSSGMRPRHARRWSKLCSLYRMLVDSTSATLRH